MLVRNGKRFNINAPEIMVDGMLYPQTAFYKKEILDSLNIQEIPDPEYPSAKFYDVVEIDVEPWIKATPKTMEDFVPAEENPIITKGARSQYIDEINDTIYKLLQSTDYVDVRNLQDKTYKPEWVEWRNLVRETGKSIKEKISSSKTIKDLESIVIQWPKNPDQI